MASVTGTVILVSGIVIFFVTIPEILSKFNRTGIAVQKSLYNSGNRITLLVFIILLPVR